MREIALTQGKVALVSDEDYADLSLYKWCVSAQGRKGQNKLYAIRRHKGRKIWMHRLIMGLNEPFSKYGNVVDHMDGNGLNNQRENLRVVSHVENSMAPDRYAKYFPK